MIDFNAAGRRATAAPAWNTAARPSQAQVPNPIREFFNARQQGAGIWKWDHYFDVYHRHFNRFRGQEVHILEIGIYSGGSLELWREYFGPAAHIYGVDIEPACKAYEAANVKVFIGDQQDRGFWREFRHAVPSLDIVIDDGGHQARQQIVSVEELLPHLRPGGVYLCEDVQRECNAFAVYAQGMADMLNSSEQFVKNLTDPERRIVSKPTPFQSNVASVAFYPFVAVIERRAAPLAEFRAPKHGTEWEPFLR